MAKRKTQPEKQEKIEIGGWRIRHLSDAFTPRPPREYIVEGLFPLSSLSIVFGAEGSMKSLLMMDMAICISEGLPWLQYEDGSECKFKTKKSNVLYIDCDNGSLTDDERINAFALSHGMGADERSPFTYIAMPENFDISNQDCKNNLSIILQALQIKVLILDNLGLINSADENSHDMAAVMSNLRQLADRGICVIVIHHQRKSNGAGGKLGEMLRGHSSIAASLDLSFFVSRKDINENDIMIIPTKSRFAPIELFGAKFTYTWISDTKELETALFVSYDVENEQGKAITLIPQILQGVEMPKTQLMKELMKYNISQRAAKSAIEKCISNETILAKKGKHNTTFLSFNIDLYAEHLEEILAK